MFTGIITAIGTITSIENAGGDRRMSITATGDVLRGVAPGDSVAVNGICLTAASLIAQGFVADVSNETLNATSAAQWQPQQRVNLETALRAGQPLGGHLVAGHVDGVAKLLSREDDARSIRMEFAVPQELARYITRKGSICIDGISLTVNEVRCATFGVNIIPHTATATTLGGLPVGGAVNLEIDLMARYLERLLQAREENQ